MWFSIRNEFPFQPNSFLNFPPGYVQDNSMAIRGLYAIADPAWAGGRTPVALARTYVEGGCRLIQLRAKSESRSQIQTWAQEIMALKKQCDFTFIVNDHVDVALEVGADGVHVGANDTPVAAIRKRAGPKFLIGYSSHSLEEAVAAEKAGTNYVAFGAIFPSKTKGPGHSVQGLEKLRDVVAALKVPVVAIGGITRANFEQVRDTGAAAIAMITALTETPSVMMETAHFVSLLK